jgi:hypothetical protein
MRESDENRILRRNEISSFSERRHKRRMKKINQEIRRKLQINSVRDKLNTYKEDWIQHLDGLEPEGMSKQC